MIERVLDNSIVHTPHDVVLGGIGIEDGRIVSIFSQGNAPEARETIDCRGQHLLPGIVDCHGILGREDWSETARDESIHAVVNGVTTVLSYVQMGDGLSPHRARVHAEADQLCRRESFVNYKFSAVTNTPEQLEEIPELIESGVASFNFTINNTRNPEDTHSLDWAFIYRAMERIAEYSDRAFVTFHCEEPDIIELLARRAQAQGVNDLTGWAETRPSYAEAMQVYPAGLIARELGVRANFTHVAAPESVAALRSLRELGAPVFAETAPQYLSLAASDVGDLTGKQMPPLREEANIERLWDGIRDGTLSMIGSDHQISRSQDKLLNGDLWGEATVRSGSGGGLAGSIAPIMLEEGIRRNRIDWHDFVALTASNAAKLWGIYPRKGAITLGADADVILIDPDQTWEMSVESLRINSDYCLWAGKRVRGRVTATYIAGDLIAANGELVRNAPSGRLVESLSGSWS